MNLSLSSKSVARALGYLFSMQALVLFIVNIIAQTALNRGMERYNQFTGRFIRSLNASDRSLHEMLVQLQNLLPLSWLLMALMACTAVLCLLRPQLVMQWAIRIKLLQTFSNDVETNPYNKDQTNGTNP